MDGTQIFPFPGDMEEFGQAAEKIRSIPEELVEERITAYEKHCSYTGKPLTAVLSADSFFPCALRSIILFL